MWYLRDVRGSRRQRRRDEQLRHGGKRLRHHRPRWFGQQWEPKWRLYGRERWQPLCERLCGRERWQPLWLMMEETRHRPSADGSLRST